ncbi:MAG: hypothetical protein R3C45_07895 [Phycisphaerales bacterium]
MRQETDHQTDETTPSDVVLVDSHVHLYDCFDRVTFFDSALNNLRHAAQALGLPADTPGCLMFTEMSGDHAFESLIKQHKLPGGWTFHPAAEGRSLVAAKDGRDVLTLIAGRQIVTRENIEVLALCCNEEFTDGRAVEHTIEKVIEVGGLPVLPYGVGKWSGARGVIVDDLLNSALGSRLMLGDNAGRLSLAGEPKQFALARERGVWVLPGTDPLPFPAQARGVGRYGMVLTGGIDPGKPAASAKQSIETANQQPRVFGRTDGPIRFLGLQSAMQLRKRLRKR